MPFLHLLLFRMCKFMIICDEYKLSILENLKSFKQKIIQLKKQNRETMYSFLEPYFGDGSGGYSKISIYLRTHQFF